MHNGPQTIESIFASQALDALLGRVLASKRVADILHIACRRKGIRFDIRNQTHIVCGRNGITINTTTPTMASKLKQIQPTLEQALFVGGCHLPIIAIQAGKFSPTVIDQNPPALGAVRTGDQKASDSLWQSAQKAKDDDVKAALERLSRAVKP